MSPDAAYFELVNSILTQSAPTSAFYCVGLASGWAWENQRHPDRELLEAAAACKWVDDTFDVFWRWLNVKTDADLKARADSRS